MYYAQSQKSLCTDLEATKNLWAKPERVAEAYNESCKPHSNTLTSISTDIVASKSEDNPEQHPVSPTTLSLQRILACASLDALLLSRSKAAKRYRFSRISG